MKDHSSQTRLTVANDGEVLSETAWAGLRNSVLYNIGQTSVA